MLSVSFKFLGASKMLEAKIFGDFLRQIKRGRVNEFEDEGGFKSWVD